MKKDLIIIALIILVIYLAYQQQENNQSANIIESPNTQQLRSELNHYQTLYQQRVERDVGNEEKISELEEQITLLEEIINKPLNDVATQTELTEEDIINLNKSVEYYQALSEQKEQIKENLVKQLTLIQQDLKNSQDNSQELETLLEYNSAEDFSDTDRQVAKFFTSLFK